MRKRAQQHALTAFALSMLLDGCGGGGGGGNTPPVSLSADQKASEQLLLASAPSPVSKTLGVQKQIPARVLINGAVVPESLTVNNVKRRVGIATTRRNYC